MKKFFAVLLTASVLFTACQNDSSSTIGDYDSEEETHTTEKKEGHHNAESKEENHTTRDTARHGEEHGVGAEVSVDRNGVDVDTKSFKTDSTRH